MLFKGFDLFHQMREGDTLFFTANSTITRSGELVMGKGIALDVKKRWPESAKVLGRDIAQREKIYGLSDPTYAVKWKQGWIRLIAFQTKIHFKDPSPLEVISYSVEKTLAYLDAYPLGQCHLPFPGINNGQLDPKAVWPIIKVLPDRVNIYMY